MSCYVLRNSTALWGDCCEDYGVVPGPIWVTGFVTSMTTLMWNYSVIIGWRWWTKEKAPLSTYGPSLLVTMVVVAKFWVHFVAICVSFADMKSKELAQGLTTYERYFGFGYLQFENLALYDGMMLIFLYSSVMENRFAVFLDWIRTVDATEREELKKSQDRSLQQACEMHERLDRVNNIILELSKLMFELKVGKMKAEPVRWDSHDCVSLCEMICAPMNEKITRFWKENMAGNLEKETEVLKVIREMKDFDFVVLTNDGWARLLRRFLRSIETMVKSEELLEALKEMKEVTRVHQITLKPTNGMDDVKVFTHSATFDNDGKGTDIVSARFIDLFMNREVKKQEMVEKYGVGHFRFVVAMINALALNEPVLSVDDSSKGALARFEALLQEGEELEKKIRKIRTWQRDMLMDKEDGLVGFAFFVATPIIFIFICYLFTHSLLGVLMFLVPEALILAFVGVICFEIVIKISNIGPTKVQQSASTDMEKGDHGNCDGPEQQTEFYAVPVLENPPNTGRLHFLAQSGLAIIRGTCFVLIFTFTIRYSYLMFQTDTTYFQIMGILPLAPGQFDPSHSILRCPAATNQILANLRKFQIIF